MKAILLICLLIGLGLQVTVTDSDKCSACTEFKSQTDCENSSNNLSCEWKTSACAQKTTTTETFKSYCENVADPATKCAKTFGCAYIESKCTHFTGCTAYVKTTLSDCQAISYQCITNGVTCDDVKLCKDYTKDACETNPSPYSPYKCKLDGDTCRDYKCSEADTTLAKTADCDAWLDGCVTTGYGCIDVLPSCNSYTGTSDSCNKMVGKDGNCTLDASSTASPQACKLRVCSEATLTTWTDDTCGAYQYGCKSTGFSCVDKLLSCTTYQGNSTSCLNFVGSDGQCAADAAATTCRPRKCEDKVSGVLADCSGYSACVTNGVTCVSSLGKCNSYKGTIATCGKIVGSDGNCKGTSATDATIACSLKDCAADDAGTETTDDACKKIQTSCKTTGKGCVATLLSCTTYDDDGKCANYVGLEGNCKTGAGGATPKCAIRQCSDNTTATTNDVCAKYLPGCVTNGAGCVAEATCTDTVSKLTCQGTTKNYTCGWTESCARKDCTQLTNQSLCSNTSISAAQPCIWKINQCYNAVCSDFTETDDTKCDGHMQGCVTNGTKCADPTDCTQFAGTMTTCRAFTKAKCTNTDDSVPATTACKPKDCTDTNITASQDSDCDAYLTGCLFAGSNTCISNLKDCSKYLGSSTTDCSKFTGYLTATTRATCWYDSGSNCVDKTCDLAISMTSNADCAGFMTGCVFDGKDSCVEEDSECTSFSFKTNASECRVLTGKKTTQKCYDGSGTSCKIRECTDAPASTDYDTDIECDGFLTGCVTKGQGCVLPTALCTSFSGTPSKCAGYKGNNIPCLRTKACIAPTLTCAGKTDATTNSQCKAYKSGCVLTFGSNTCQDSKTNCTDYTLSGTSDTDKATFCNSVTTSGGAQCAYDPAVTGTCSAIACNLWSVALGGTCTSFTTSGTCTLGLNQQCFKIGACTTYKVPTSLTTATQKKTFCNNQWSSTGGQCVYDGTSNCKAITTCEEVISPANQDDCYDQSGSSSCVFIASSCVTIKAACTGYDVTGITGASAATDKATLCSKLKSKSGSTFALCKYDAAAAAGTCVNAACEDISSPASQADCSIVSSTNCHYYSSKCYTIKDCAQQVVSGSLSDDEKLKFCQNMYHTGGTQFCSFDKTVSATNCGAPKSCTEYAIATAAACQKKRDKTGVICTNAGSDPSCSIPTTAGENCTLITTGITADSDCDVLTTPNACIANSGACAVSAACTTVTGSKLSECEGVRDTSGFFCTWTTGTKCEAGKSNCTDWSGTQLTDCSDKKDKHGNTCEWVTGNTTCTNATTCEDAASPASQADCDLISSGCIFYNASCIKNSAACTDYTFPAAVNDNTKKFTYCNGRVNSSAGQCTFTDGSSNCVDIGACSSYAAVGTGVSDKLAYCQMLLTTDNYDCTYATGAKCMNVADLCTSYTVATAADCTSLKDTLGRSCLGTSTTCSYIACKDITGATSQSYCDLKAPGCTYQNNKCVQLGACNSYTTGSTGAITLCNGLKDNNGNFCNATADTDANCSDRLCNDAATTYFTSNTECQAYSSNCKSDGLGCVALSTACTTFNKDSSQCSWFLDTNGISACVADTPDTDTQTCTATTCEMNVLAATQADCDNYIPQGGCRWKNPGCYSKSVPCSQYRGFSSDCLIYVGNSVKCYSDTATATVRGTCRDRTCADLKTATSDADCSAFLTDCVYNGVGCVSKTAHCSAFTGTSTTCKNFKADSGATLCWGTSATPTTCVDRKCTQLTGTSDADCEAHMPSTHCISDGTTCVQGPLTCDKFKGNDDTCSKFTAQNGPCKATSQSVTAVQCTPRVCYEASNTFTTDAQCKAYHSSCVTNGRGCQSSVSCGDYQNKTACAANNTCLWATSCRMTYTTCSSLTSQGQTVCVNNPTKKCAWFSGNGTPANAACRDYQCADYDATLTTHDACMKASTNQCTTTGAGCVAYSICSSYTTATMCGAAQTTETQKKCTWENAKCRTQQCKDLKGTTDDDCKNQLPGCKTNGTTCIGPSYNCSDFNGSQKFCQIDSTGQPCLYVNGTCYSYDECTDVSSPSKTVCTAFSPNCVVGTSTCIALNQCSQYKDQVSCYSGISKSVCGWTPDSKCAEFKQCSDAQGTTWNDCRNWNSSCVSDGSVCVPIGDCGSYQKQLSCETNYDTNQNICFWTGTACRQKQCGDATATTDVDCLSNTLAVKEGPCTSDGQKCVVRAACTAYGSQAACTVGSDAIPCWFGYPVGATTGTQSCRAQECTDIVGTTNDACIGKINKKPCVSNGKNCVAQGTCASYKNKLSCAGGGSDNSQCVFTAAATATDPLAGTCVAFTACASANGDKTTCLTNKSCKYTDATNKCETTDCATYNGSGKCYPFPSFDGKSFTLCVSSATGCTAGDPTAIVQTDCWATTKYSYTWNASTNKCASCKGSTPANNSSNGNNSNGSTTTDSGYVLGASMVLALLGFMA